MLTTASAVPGPSLASVRRVRSPLKPLTCHTMYWAIRCTLSGGLHASAVGSTARAASPPPSALKRRDRTLRGPRCSRKTSRHNAASQVRDCVLGLLPWDLGLLGAWLDARAPQPRHTPACASASAAPALGKAQTPTQSVAWQICLGLAPCLAAIVHVAKSAGRRELRQARGILPAPTANCSGWARLFRAGGVCMSHGGPLIWT